MKILVLTTIRAPYRVQLFNLLGRKCDLTVCFENEYEDGREEQWYDKEILDFEDIQLRQTSTLIKWEINKIFITKKPDLAIAFEYSTMTALYFMILSRKNQVPYIINCDGGFIKNNIIKSYIKKEFIKSAAGFLPEVCMQKDIWNIMGLIVVKY